MNATELGAPDASGRRRPVEVPGSNWELQVDVVIEAIGAKPVRDSIEWEPAMKLSDGNLITVNPDTGEVTEADALLQCLKRECANRPDFIDQRIPLAAAVFRIFLINNNQPLTAADLAAYLNRKPTDVLAQIGQRVVYNGIRPIRE